MPYVAPIEIELGTTTSRKMFKGKRIIYEQSETFMYIPILDSLNVFLGNSLISDMILKHPEYSFDDVYYDVCDGSIFRNDSYFEEHPHSLVLVLYHDEIDVCNPLGSHATVHKLDITH